MVQNKCFAFLVGVESVFCGVDSAVVPVKIVVVIVGEAVHDYSENLEQATRTFFEQ